tara:strand:+ start:3426 stop:3647 length:222 start_codon:yes stop_codon:yes gene_type:complete
MTQKELKRDIKKALKCNANKQTNKTELVLELVGIAEAFSQEIGLQAASLAVDETLRELKRLAAQAEKETTNAK